jgi:hypothetical protein
MLFFSMVPNWMLGSIRVDMEVHNDFSLISRSEGLNCDSVTMGGIDLDEKVTVGDVDNPDVIGCFLETIEGITRELCSLLLRTCSKDRSRSNWSNQLRRQGWRTNT